MGVTSEFSLEFYNYFMPLDLQSIINYLFGLAWAKALGEAGDRETEKKRQSKSGRESTDKKKEQGGDEMRETEDRQSKADE